MLSSERLRAALDYEVYVYPSVPCNHLEGSFQPQELTQDVEGETEEEEGLGRKKQD